MVPDTYTVPATIESATPAERGEEKRWSLKIKVPFSQHAITTFIGRDEATLDDLVKGSTHMVTLGRGRKIKDDSDGEKPWQYHWDVTAWDTKAAPTPSANGDGQGEFRRSLVEMRWTEAISMSTAMAATRSTIDRPQLIENAQWFYDEIEAGPLSLRDQQPANGAPAAAQSPVAEPAEAEAQKDANGEAPYCTKHRKPYDQTSANSKRRFHQAGSYPCVEGIGVVNPETGEPIKPGGKK